MQDFYILKQEKAGLLHLTPGNKENAGLLHFKAGKGCTFIFEAWK